MKYLFQIFIILSSLTSLNAEELERVYSETECYTILEKLGEGALGKVYLVEDSSGQQYALKSFKPRDDHSTGDFMAILADAQREFALGQELNHPNIIRTYDFFEYEETNYLLLQLVNGKPLYKIEKKSLSREEAASAALEFVQALHLAQLDGYWFVDCHIGNVMLDDEGHLWIIDLASFFARDELVDLLKVWQYSTSSYSSYSSSSYSDDLSDMDPSVRLHRIQKQRRLIRELIENHKSEGNSEEPEIDSKIVKHYDATSYAARISWVAGFLFDQTDLTTEEKIELRTKIYSLAWRHCYEAEDENFLPIESFYQEFEELLAELYNATTDSSTHNSGS